MFRGLFTPFVLAILAIAGLVSGSFILTGSASAATGHTTHPSSGPAPFGFDFGNRNTLVVSEAANSAASSYRVSDNGTVSLVSGSVANGQAAACWVVVTKIGRYAYTADAHNGMISGYAIAHDGSLVSLTGASGLPASASGLVAR